MHLTQSNPYMLIIKKFHISEKKDITIEDFIKHYFIIEKKPKQKFNSQNSLIYILVNLKLLILIIMN